MTYIKHKSEESLEDYLETILILDKKIPNVRSIDIATELGFSKPSVSIAMKNLKNLGYIVINQNNYIKLTDTGYKRAKNVLDRHELLRNWLIKLGVNENIASEDACKMEHDISDESFSAIKKFIESL